MLAAKCYPSYSLHWRHNDHGGVSNHQPRGCLLNHLFRRRWKKTSKLRVTGLCAGNSPATGEFPAQRASNAENVSIWWRHHVNSVHVFISVGCRVTCSHSWFGRGAMIVAEVNSSTGNYLNLINFDHRETNCSYDEVLYFVDRAYIAVDQFIYCSSIRNCTSWRHQMETFSALLALCEGSSTVTDGFP